MPSTGPATRRFPLGQPLGSRLERRCDDSTMPFASVRNRCLASNIGLRVHGSVTRPLHSSGPDRCFARRWRVRWPWLDRQLRRDRWAARQIYAPYRAHRTLQTVAALSLFAPARHRTSLPTSSAGRWQPAADIDPARRPHRSVGSGRAPFPPAGSSRIRGTIRTSPSATGWRCDRPKANSPWRLSAGWHPCLHASSDSHVCDRTACVGSAEEVVTETFYDAQRRSALVGGAIQ